MRNYTTQMEAARKGIVTKELETVAAKKERMTVEELMPLVASGKWRSANKNSRLYQPGEYRLHAKD